MVQKLGSSDTIVRAMGSEDALPAAGRGFGQIKIDDFPSAWAAAQAAGRWRVSAPIGHVERVVLLESGVSVNSTGRAGTGDVRRRSADVFRRFTRRTDAAFFAGRN